MVVSLAIVGFHRKTLIWKTAARRHKRNDAFPNVNDPPVLALPSQVVGAPMLADTLSVAMTPHFGSFAIGGSSSPSMVIPIGR